MSGWNTIEKMQNLERSIDNLGLKFARCELFDNQALVRLVPKDHEALPIYSRNADVYTGSLESVEYWLQGVEWARNYDRMNKISTDEKRAKAEQRERNTQLMRTLKEGKRVEGVVE